MVWLQSISLHRSAKYYEDPSNGMVEQARSAMSQDTFSNFRFAVTPAETMPFVEDQTVNVIVYG